MGSCLYKILSVWATIHESFYPCEPLVGICSCGFCPYRFLSAFALAWVDYCLCELLSVWAFVLYDFSCGHFSLSFCPLNFFPVLIFGTVLSKIDISCFYFLKEARNKLVSKAELNYFFIRFT